MTRIKKPCANPLCNDGKIPCEKCHGKKPCKTCGSTGVVNCTCNNTYAAKGTSLDQTGMSQKARFFKKPGISGSQI